MHPLLFFFVFLLFPHSHLFQSCIYSNTNQEPSAGNCNGPVQRVLLRQANLLQSNQGCSNGQVLFYEDGDISKPKCGNCIPGTSGISDPKKMCTIEQYCTDNATCADIRAHPLYKAVCPYHLEDDVGGFCGPGLTCYQHICLPCVDGMYDTADGKMCVMNMWTYNKWNMLIYDPQSSLLAILCGVIVILGIISVFVEFILCCVKKAARDKKIVFLRGMKDEVTRALKWAKGDEEGWEEKVLNEQSKPKTIASSPNPLPSTKSPTQMIVTKDSSNYLPLVSPKKNIKDIELEEKQPSRNNSFVEDSPQSFYASRIALVPNRKQEEQIVEGEEDGDTTPRRMPVSRRLDSMISPPSASRRLPMHIPSTSSSPAIEISSTASNRNRRLPVPPPRSLRKSFDEEHDEY